MTEILNELMYDGKGYNDGVTKFLNAGSICYKMIIWGNVLPFKWLHLREKEPLPLAGCGNGTRDHKDHPHHHQLLIYEYVL